jgi:hypothetical protein
MFVSLYWYVMRYGQQNMKYGVFPSFEAVNPGMWLTTSGRKVPPLLLVCRETKATCLYTTFSPYYLKIVKRIIYIQPEPFVHSVYSVGQGKDLCASRNQNHIICHAFDESKYKFSHFELKEQYHICKNSSGGSLCIIFPASNSGFHQSFEMMPHIKWKKMTYPPLLVFEVLKESLIRFDLTFYKLISH